MKIRKFIFFTTDQYARPILKLICPTLFQLMMVLNTKNWKAEIMPQTNDMLDIMAARDLITVKLKKILKIGKESKENGFNWDVYEIENKIP